MDDSAQTIKDEDCFSIVSNTTQGSDGFDSPVFQTSLKMLRVGKADGAEVQDDTHTDNLLSSPFIAVIGPTLDQTQKQSDDDSMSCMSESLLSNTKSTWVQSPTLRETLLLSQESSHARADNPLQLTQEAEQSQSLLASQIGNTDTGRSQSNTDNTGPSCTMAQKCLTSLGMVLNYLTNSSGNKATSDEKHVMEKVEECQSIIMKTLVSTPPITETPDWKGCVERVKSILTHLNRSHSDEREDLGRKVKQKGQSKSEKLSLRQQLQSLSSRQNILLTLFEKQREITRTLRKSSIMDKGMELRDSQLTSGSRSSDENRELTSRSTGEPKRDSVLRSDVKEAVCVEQSNQSTSGFRSSDENKKIMPWSSGEPSKDSVSRSGVREKETVELSSLLTSKTSDKNKVPLRFNPGTSRNSMDVIPGTSCTGDPGGYLEPGKREPTADGDLGQSVTKMGPSIKKRTWEEIVGLTNNTPRPDESFTQATTAEDTLDRAPSDQSLDQPQLASSGSTTQLTSAGWTRKQTFPNSFQEIVSRYPTSFNVAAKKRKITDKNEAKSKDTQITVGKKRLEVLSMDTDDVESITQTNKTSVQPGNYTTEVKVLNPAGHQDIDGNTKDTGSQNEQTAPKQFPTPASKPRTAFIPPKVLPKIGEVQSWDRLVHGKTLLDCASRGTSNVRVIQVSSDDVGSISSDSRLGSPSNLLHSSSIPVVIGSNSACPEPTLLLVTPEPSCSISKSTEPLSGVTSSIHASARSQVHNSQVSSATQLTAVQTDPVSSKCITLSQLLQSGIVIPGHNVISATVKDMVMWASLTEDGYLTSTVGQFKTPAHWLSAVSGSTVKKSQAYKRVMYKGQPLNKFKISEDKMSSIKPRHQDAPVNADERSAQPQRMADGTHTIQPSDHEDLSCASTEVISLSALLSHCKVRLIEDEELIPSHMFLPDNFWSTEFGQLRISEDLWNTVENW